MNIYICTKVKVLQIKILINILLIGPKKLLQMLIQYEYIRAFRTSLTAAQCAMAMPI